MNNPASDWLVLIRPSVAGFDSTRDTAALRLGQTHRRTSPESFIVVRAVRL